MRNFSRSVALAAAFLAASAPVWAAADFYGVKMKSEDFAQSVFLVDSPKIPDFTNDRPGTDKRVYAYGYMSSVLGGGKGIALEVFNHSDGPITTDRLFRELTVITYDGRRYDRAEPEMMWSRDVLKPGEHATFNFKFPGARIHRDEVRMVICSFDMGQTMLFLFPLRPGDQAAVAAKEAEKASSKKVVKKKVVKKSASGEGHKHPIARAAIACLTPVKLVETVLTSFGPRRPAAEEEVVEEVVEEAEEAPAAAPEAKRAPDKEVPPDYPLVKVDQVVDGTQYRFTPEHRQQVKEAEKETETRVQKDRMWRLSNPGASSWTHTEKTLRRKDLPRREAKVLLVNPDYGFVVVDAGFEQGFGKNVILNVMRSGRRIAKVMVTKPRDKIAGAVILPEWRTRDEIRVGDVVGISP